MMMPHLPFRFLAFAGVYLAALVLAARFLMKSHQPLRPPHEAQPTKLRFPLVHQSLRRARIRRSLRGPRAGSAQGTAEPVSADKPPLSLEDLPEPHPGTRCCREHWVDYLMSSNSAGLVHHSFPELQAGAAEVQLALHLYHAMPIGLA